MFFLNFKESEGVGGYYQIVGYIPRESQKKGASMDYKGETMDINIQNMVASGFAGTSLDLNKISKALVDT